MLQRLGPIGKEVLLRLINLTLEKGDTPQIWRNALLVPTLKKGKNPAEPRSYRPISLTSRIAKIAERMINRRLYVFGKYRPIGKKTSRFSKRKMYRRPAFSPDTKHQGWVPKQETYPSCLC